MSDCNKFSQDAGGTECNYGPLCSSWWSCHTLIISVLLRLWPDASRTSPGSHRAKTSKNWKKYVHYSMEGIPGEFNKCQWNKRTTLCDHSRLVATDDWIIMKMRQLSCSYGKKHKWIVTFYVLVTCMTHGCRTKVVFFHLSDVRRVYGASQTPPI